LEAEAEGVDSVFVLGTLQRFQLVLQLAADHGLRPRFEALLEV
jgi:hypothetical protein